jgi:D-alanyl-D-alanine dipeptidase
MRYPKGKPEPIKLLNRVCLQESGEPLVHLRRVCPGIRVLRPTAVPYLRERVAQMLQRARLRLAPEFDIGVREAWRSLDRQRLIYDTYFERLRGERPELSYAALRRLANRYFAPYDQKAPPGHSTGGAVDVWLLDARGKPIDLHGPGERFASAATFHPRLPKEILDLRLILYQALTKEGFTNCKDEWWHYSFGDAAWAVRTGRKKCFYGYIEPPREAYRSRDERFRREFLSK